MLDQICFPEKGLTFGEGGDGGIGSHIDMVYVYVPAF